jgi:hypothetical protein
MGPMSKAQAQFQKPGPQSKGPYTSTTIAKTKICGEIFSCFSHTSLQKPSTSFRISCTKVYYYYCYLTQLEKSIAKKTNTKQTQEDIQP